jgi:chorismate mutase
MPVRGIRGATTAHRNTAEAIVEATTELLTELVGSNEVRREDVCFAYFTTTLDLDAEFPALAARQLGWIGVPLLCGNDMVVRGPNPRSVPMCIRILLLYNTDRAQSEMKSAYLRGAQAIRADLDRTAGELNIQ